MRRLQRSEVTREGLWEVMSTGPVFNELTVYVSATGFGGGVRGGKSSCCWVPSCVV